MSKQQYTPGPWNYSNAYGYWAIYGKSNQEIALIAKTTHDDKTVEADAHLIAAAPDLLAACKLAKQHLDAMRLESGLGNVLSPMEKAAFEQVDAALTAAIEKAEVE